MDNEYPFMIKTQKAFTLIELLIVIAIIGILVATIILVMRNVRFKAKNASFRSSADSVKTALMMCCDGGGQIQEKGSTDGSIAVCDDTDIIDASYPDDEHIGNVTVDVQCDDGHFEVTVTPGTKNMGTCTSIRFNEAGEIARNGC